MDARLARRPMSLCPLHLGLPGPSVAQGLLPAPLGSSSHAVNSAANTCFLSPHGGISCPSPSLPSQLHNCMSPGGGQGTETL